MVAEQRQEESNVTANHAATVASLHNLLSELSRNNGDVLRQFCSVRRISKVFYTYTQFLGNPGYVRPKSISHRDAITLPLLSHSVFKFPRD